MKIKIAIKKSDLVAVNIVIISRNVNSICHIANF